MSFYKMPRDQMVGCCEPTLEEILADSIVRAVMEADGVDPQELDAMIRRIASKRAATVFKVVELDM